jgi:TRAP-type C4-dicarboxylate transport system substrate-binding protein
MIHLNMCRFAGLMASAMATTVFATAVSAKEFQVVGTPGDQRNWTEHESRFWRDTLPAISEGRLTASARPLNELGLSGSEAMRMLKLGTYDAIHGLVSYAASESPVLEGIDLAGVAQDFDTYRRVVSAYRPIVSRELREKYNARLLALYTFPSQQLWCNLGKSRAGPVSLKTLADKKIRTFSTSTSDLVEGLGAKSVTVAFREMVPALKRGVADCGVAGTVQAYDVKWWRVATHNFQIRVGYATAFMAMNMDAWQALDPAERQAIEAEAIAVEDALWQANQQADQVGMDCNTSGPCASGDAGGMTGVKPSESDQQALKKIVQDVVLSRWAKRCGDACATDWNNSVGKIVEMTAADK